MTLNEVSFAFWEPQTPLERLMCWFARSDYYITSIFVTDSEGDSWALADHPGYGYKFYPIRVLKRAWGIPRVVSPDLWMSPEHIDTYIHSIRDTSPSKPSLILWWITRGYYKIRLCTDVIYDLTGLSITCNNDRLPEGALHRLEAAIEDHRICRSWPKWEDYPSS